MKDIFVNDPVGGNEFFIWKVIDIDKIGDFKNVLSNFKILKEEIIKQKIGI
jgi:hypothetical protein